MADKRYVQNPMLYPNTWPVRSIIGLCYFFFWFLFLLIYFDFDFDFDFISPYNGHLLTTKAFPRPQAGHCGGVRLYQYRQSVFLN